MNNKELLHLLQSNNEIKNHMKQNWTEIGGKEYIFSPAFGGERINILVREKNKVEKYYNIVFSIDIDDI